MITAKSVDRISHWRGSIVTVPASESVAKAAACMRDCEVGSILAVSEKSEVAGILTERDIVTKVIAAGKDPAAVTIGEVMSRKLVSVGPNTPADEAQRIMAIHNIRHLPIMDKGRPIGMVSSRDLLTSQLNAVTAVVEKQSRVLQELERTNPGITHLATNTAGRLVI